MRDFEYVYAYVYMSFVHWLWSVISPALVLKTIPDALDTTVHRQASPMLNSSVPNTCGYTGYALHAGYTATCSSNRKNYDLGWNSGLALTSWVLIEPSTSDRRGIRPWAEHSGFVARYKLYNSLVHSSGNR